MNEREQLLRSRVADLEEYAQKRACPIFGISDCCGCLIGSGFLLKVGEKTILVSAAHVLNTKPEVVLYGAGDGLLVPIEGRRYTTLQYGPKGLPDYKQDIAFVILTPEAAAAIVGTVLVPQDIDANDLPAARTLYGFAGFPGSQNRPRPGRIFRRSSVIYTAVPAPEEPYRNLKYDRRTHFAVSFEREQMITHDMRVSKAPDPRGVSGGPVWRLGSLSDIEAGIAKPTVVALAIEYHRDLKVLVGVRMSVVAEAIRKATGQTASLFQPNAHVKVNVELNHQS